MSIPTESHLEKYALDAEVAAALNEILAAFPGGFNAPKELSDRRALIKAFLSQAPLNESVSRIDDQVNNPSDGHLVPIRIYRPLTGVHSDGVVLAIHGGGMVMGSIAEDDSNAARLSIELGVTVIAVDYRLAPEYPFPAPVEDCFTVASWILDHGSEIGVDLSRSIIYGGSAGGGLSIATSMALRDRLGRNFKAVVAPYPMVDHRNCLPSTQRIVDMGVWDRQANIESWAWYLGNAQESTAVHPYASPLHADDLSGLPDTFIDVGTADLFLDEDFLLASRLLESGVQVEFHCYPGAYHACELFAPDADLSQAIWRNRFDFMRKRL